MSFLPSPSSEAAPLLFVDDDGQGEPTLWRHDAERPDQPTALAGRCDMHPAAWEILKDVAASFARPGSGARMVTLVAEQREAFLASPRLDRAWVAGWHSAVDHVAHTVRAASQEEAAFRSLLALGVTLGAPVALSEGEKAVGHTACAFHIEDAADGYDLDGGSATSILSLLSSGTYGLQPQQCVLRPCL